MNMEQAVQLAEIRQAVQQLRDIHHGLRHPHIEGCAECITLKWLQEHDF